MRLLHSPSLGKRVEVRWWHWQFVSVQILYGKGLKGQSDGPQCQTSGLPFSHYLEAKRKRKETERKSTCWGKKCYSTEKNIFSRVRLRVSCASGCCFQHSPQRPIESLVSHHKCQPPQKTWQESRLVKSRAPCELTASRFGQCCQFKEKKKGRITVDSLRLPGLNPHSRFLCTKLIFKS